MSRENDATNHGEIRIRKRLLAESTAGPGNAIGIDIIQGAAIAYSSDTPLHPIENILDRRDGPGGTYWQSDRLDVTERIVIEFDAPQAISRIIFEVEETGVERTQEVRIEALRHENWTQLLVQEYTFSPQGAKFQREDIRVNATGVVQLRLTIVPNKNGSGKATLTSLRLFP